MGKDHKRSSTISSKGQVTVPLEIRERLGLSAGDRIEFVVEGERTVIRPARSGSSPFDKYKGSLGAFPGGAKEINFWLREMREHETQDDEAPSKARRGR